MALTKAYTAAVGSGTSNTAGSTTNSSTLTIGYGISIVAKVTNGGTGPTVGCDVIIQVSHDGATWQEWDRRTAGVTASTTYTFAFRLGIGDGGDWLDARVQFSGNTAQTVTVQADAESTTSL